MLLVAAAGIGLLAWRRPRPALVAIGALGLVGVGAALLRSGLSSGGVWSAVPSIVAGAVGVGSLALITRAVPRLARPGDSTRLPHHHDGSRRRFLASAGRGRCPRRRRRRGRRSRQPHPPGGPGADPAAPTEVGRGADPRRRPGGRGADLHHPQRRLLPGGHLPGHAPGRRRHLEADHRRRRRPPAGAHLRPAARAADDRAGHHAWPASPTRSAERTSAPPAGSGCRSARSSPGSG